ncbi:hypothetical protein [Winogradskyella aurantia]|uniref:Uncharacterized protein n=1 Tax=Winogradskyella aurantia TaxID=1915063 RepID=A0A265UT52_9FLAO|nr:hypothetical protein [Winogradskyella aurantia]OZV68488.1 hypothetical protein CA834_08405 [Winogradskyella aurantia]
MKLYNKLRFKMIEGRRLRNYLFYALGEIILVAIGILIAVAINDYQEQKAAEIQLENYLSVYKQDLEIDSTVVGQTLNFIDTRKPFFKLFLSDTVTAKTYQDNPQGYGLTLSYSPLQLQQKGISLLENYVNDSDSEIEQDTLVSNILAMHRYYDNLITTSIKRISDDIDNNMMYLKMEQPWIADLLLGKLDDPDIMPFYLSEQYKAQLAIHSTLVFSNLEPQLKALQNYNIETITQLNERLKKR